MVSKTFFMIALAFATVFVITSEVAATRELASNHGRGEVEDAKHDRDDHGYYDDGPRGDNDGGCWRYRDGGGHGPHNKGWGGQGGGYCKWGCCGGGGYDDGKCQCCDTQAEATAYKQTHKGQTHN